MKSQMPIDLLSILVLYGLYWAVIYVATNTWGDLDVFPPASMPFEEFLEEFNIWATTVMGLSLLATLAWYAIGQWGLKPRTKESTWLLVWLLGLIVVLAGSVVAFQLGPIPSENAAYLLLFYSGSGAVFYYLATLLFSPVNVKFIVPLSQTIRRW